MDKLRVWSIKTKEMYSDICGIEFSDTKLKLKTRTSHIILNRNDAVLMSKIGVDINNNDIYEHDIIRDPFSDKIFYEVKWKPESYSFVAQKIGSKLEIELVLLARSSEVVGNIYQNPTLLNPQGELYVLNLTEEEKEKFIEFFSILTGENKNDVKKRIEYLS